MAHNNWGPFVEAQELQQSLTSILVRQSKNDNEGWRNGIASYKCIVLCKSHPLNKHVQGDLQIENFNQLTLQQQRDCKKHTLREYKDKCRQTPGKFFLSGEKKKIAYLKYYILQYSFLPCKMSCRHSGISCAMIIFLFRSNIVWMFNLTWILLLLWLPPHELWN